MNKFKSLLAIIAIITIPLCGYLLYKQLSSHTSEDEFVVTNNMVVEKIESLGKIELCKFYIKDVLELVEERDYLPDPKLLLIISGEVTACIDLKKIDSTAISITPEKISIRLPEPEICYVKINHQESKVYDIQNEYFDKSKLIDKGYASAEKNILDAALKMGIIKQTHLNAQTTLKPLLQSFTGKKVEFVK